MNTDSYDSGTLFRMHIIVINSSFGVRNCQINDFSETAVDTYHRCKSSCLSFSLEANTIHVSNRLLRIPFTSFVDFRTSVGKLWVKNNRSLEYDIVRERVYPGSRDLYRGYEWIVFTGLLGSE